jgi:hypothetical protein
VALVELEGNFVIAKSNKAVKFLGAEEMDKIGGVVLDFVKSVEDIPYAFNLSKNEEVYQISMDIS